MNTDMAQYPHCNIVVAMDSFKGSLTSAEACEAVMMGILDAYPHVKTRFIPVSDGGDGMLDVLVQATRAQYISLEVHDPLMRPCSARYGLSPDRQTAFIEMATASGLQLVPPSQRNPMLTSTFGAGELILDALKRGCRNFIIGLGGSATNDAGLGLLQALGFRFFDRQHQELGNPTEPMNGKLMGKIVSIDTSDVHRAVWEAHFRLACDVQAPFYGPNGAAYIFAPQKGADSTMVKILDQHLRHFAAVIRKETGKDITAIPGAGAAGGMAGGIMAFLNASIESGTTAVLNAIHFKEQIAHADLIITGEGKSDRQTLMGKIPSGILKEALLQNIPTILLSGSIEDIDALNKAGFLGVFSTTPAPMTLAKAMCPDTARVNVRQTARQIIRLFMMSHR